MAPSNDRYANVPKPYMDVFDGWSYLDLPLNQVSILVILLVQAGAGFGCTSEPFDGTRRVYFVSDTARKVVDEFVADPPG